jgi:uncharacterized protein (TIGR02265 family)
VTWLRWLSLNRAMQTDPTTAAAVLIDGSMVEGLFVRALKLSGPVVVELKRLGIDLDHLEPKYPRATFHSALELVARQVYPLLTREKAIYELGRQSVEGFLDTLLGKVISTAVLLGGPDRVVEKMPKHARTGDAKYDRIKVQKVGDAHWRADVNDPAAIPEYFAGMTSAWLRRAGVAPGIELAPTGPGAFSMVIRWTKA